MRIEHMTNYSGDIPRCNHKLNYLSLGEFPQFWNLREVGCEKGDFFPSVKIENISETVRYRPKVTTEHGYKLVHSLSIGCRHI